MKCYLIENYSPDLILDKEAKYVALNQEAVFQLQSLGIDFVLLEDFYTSGEVRGDTDKFLKDQLKWFDEFDDFLKDVFVLARENDIKLASIYYYWIKYSIDNIILTTKVYHKFLQQESFDEVVFISSKNGDFIDPVLSFQNSESTYSRLFEIVAKFYNIKHSRLWVERKKSSNVISDVRSFISDFRDKGALKKIARQILPKSVLQLRQKQYLAKQIDALRNKLPEAGEASYRLLLLKTKPFLNDFYCDAVKQDIQLFYRTQEGASCLTGFNAGQEIKISINSISEVNNLDEIIQKFYSSNLVSWIDKQSGGISISSVFESRFRYFISKICPDLISRIQAYKCFFQEHQIDCVSTHEVYSIDDHAALYAAKQTSHTKALGFAHGADVAQAKSRFHYLDRQFDLFVTATELEAEHEDNLRQEFNYSEPKITYSKYFREFYDNNYQQIADESYNDTIIFVPIMAVLWPQRPVDKTQCFPMEYVRWHMALADYFATRTDHRFIWKGFYRPGQSFDLIAEYLKQRNYKNVIFNSDRLPVWFNKSNRFIFDIASTAYFEAAFLKKSILAIYRPEEQLLRDNAYQGYGKTLAAAATIEDGITKVSEFLDQPKEEYIINIDGQYPNLVKQLKEILPVKGERNVLAY